jgi:WD40 repeat protein
MRKYLLAVLLLATFAMVGLWVTRPNEPSLASSGRRLIATPVKQWDNDGSPARQAAFSQDGRLLATSNAAGDVTVRQTSDWRAIRKLNVPGGATSLVFALDGLRLLTAGYDGVVRSWQLSDGRLVRQYRGAQAALWTLDLRPDGLEMAAGGEDGIIRLWSIDTGTLRLLKGHERNVWATSYAPDGKTLVSGSFDHSVRIWRVGRAKPQVLSGHSQAVVGIDISPDGRLLATGGDDSTLRFWRVSDGKPLRLLDAGNHVYNLEFSRDGQWLASAGRARGGPGTFWHQLTGLGGTARPAHIWRVSDGKAVAALPDVDDVMYVTFSPDQRYLVTSGEDSVKLWRLDAR